MFAQIHIFYRDINFVAQEYLCPVLGLGAIEITSQIWFYYQLLILTGATFAFFYLQQKKFQTAIIQALCIVVAMLCLAGKDPYLLRIAWFPLYLVALLRLRERPGLKTLTDALILVMIWSVSAGSIAVLGTLLAIAYLFYSNKESRSNSKLLALILVTSIALGFLLFPAYPEIDYPANARLAPISQLSFKSTPLIGDSLAPNPLLAEQSQNWSLSYTGIFALIFSIYFLIFVLNRKDSPSRDQTRVRHGFIFWLLTILCLQVHLSELAYLNTISPFEVMSNVIPGMSAATPTLMLLPILLLFVVLNLSAQLSFKAGLQLLFCLSCLLILRVQGILGLGQLQLKTRDTRFSTVPLEEGPSAYVLSSYQVNPAEGFEVGAQLRKLIPGEDFTAEVVTNINQSNAKNILDHDPNTRWNTGRPQTPGDFMTITLEQARNLKRVVLSAPKTPGDFPQGIKLEVGQDLAHLATVIEQSPWNGPLRLSPKGYPYFGSQTEVEINLPTYQAVKIIRITQLGMHPTLDWSIAELELFEAKLN